MDTRCCTCWQKKYLVLLLLISHLLLVRPAAAQLPEGWSSLPPAEFLEVADGVLKSEVEVPVEVKEAIREQAVELLAQDHIVREQKFRTLFKLFRLGRRQLDAEQQALLATRLAERTVDVQQMDFDEMKARQELYSACVIAEDRKEARQVNAAIAAQWLAAHPATAINVKKLLWSLHTIQGGAPRRQEDEIREDHARQIANWLSEQTDLDSVSLVDLVRCCTRLSCRSYYVRSFAVTWKGQVVAPRTGEYVFSVNPFNINYQHPGDYNRQSMTVIVDGRKTLEATPSDWAHRGEPVMLSAGVPVSIAVEYEFEIAKEGTTTPNEPIQLDRSPAVVLSWRGPGFAQQVIPTQAFPGGLDAEYAIRFRGGRKSDQRRQLHFARTEPNIDHVWIGGHNFLCFAPEARDRLCAEVWQRVMSPEYWEACHANAIDPPAKEEGVAKGTREHLLLRETIYAAFLNANQRRQFLTTLVHYPAILQQMSFGKAYAVYTRFWHGAEKEALAVMAEWLRLHPEPKPKLRGTVKEYFYANRWRYHQLVIPAVMQFPEHMQTFEEGCLEMEDGTCCLPVAYACAYAHLQQGKVREWIAKLDERLAENSLTGDRRVNWLLARAMAEEIRRAPTSLRYSSRQERLGVGLGWLDEAMLVAESPQVKQRVIRERIARLTGCGQFDQAEQCSERLPADEQAAAFKQIAKLRKQAKKKVEQEHQKSEEAYLTELRRRRELAQSRGDSRAEETFANRIEQIEGRIEASR